MDGLKKQVFDNLREARSGDGKIDELNDNTARTFLGILKKYKEQIEQVNSKKKFLTPAGRNREIEKIQEKARQEIKEIGKLATWENQIKEVQKKFDSGEKTDIQILIQEGREREMREYLRDFRNDLDAMSAFEQKVIEGNSVAVGAITNAPFEIPIDPGILKIGVEKMRLKTNPAAAERLEVLTNGQEIYENFLNFTQAEIGVVFEDPIADIANK